MMTLPKKIAVLMGGPGSERDVSLATGKGVAQALRTLGVEVTEVDVRGEDFELAEGTELAFAAIHGTFGEDGQLQKILEDRGVPYTGEGVKESQLAFDKIFSKEEFDAHGVATPTWEIVRAGEQPKLALPLVIKAPKQGSTVGVYIVKDDAALATALTDGFQYDERLLVEKFIPARELTVGILGEQALPIIEIVAKDGFYDFAEKYPFLNPEGSAKSGGGAQHVCPAALTADQTTQVQELALRAHRALGLKVYSRVDVMLPEYGEPTVLEINTIPGMTPNSLLPEAASEAGISYPELCARIIELSLAVRGRR